MSKQLFDVEKSLQECPPSIIYKDKPGYRFKKRIVTRLDKIIPKSENQIREHLVKQSNASQLKRSFEASGWIHSKPPIAVSVNTDNKDLLDLEWGFTRYQAGSMNGWETMIVDVVEPDGAPLDVYSDKFLSNDHSGEAHTPNTCEDITNGALRAVKQGMLLDDKASVKAWIKRVTPDKTEGERRKIFRDYVSKKTSNGPVRTWHQGKGQNSVEEYAKANNLPYSGDKNFVKSGKLAYVTHYSTLKSVIGDCKQVMAEYDFKHPVHILGYIEEPKAAPALYRQRDEWMKNSQKYIDAECIWIQHIAKKCGSNLDINKIRENLGINLSGFYYQDQEPDPKNSGKTKESRVVDTYGNRVKEFDN